MIIPKKENEEKILSLAKNCATLIEQTQMKPHETLEVKRTQPREKLLLHHLSFRDCKATPPSVGS